MSTTRRASTSKESDQASAKAHAIRLVCASNLHQSLWLPATPNHPRLRVTYATTSNFSTDPKLPCILFCGPMFGSRYHVLEIDVLAAELGVRVICTDRPGMGGSTPCALEQRVQVWIETVPVLLEAVGVQDQGVALMTHSAGCAYLFNTMMRLRGVLHPAKPFVGIMAPWVDTVHSKTAIGTVASRLPTSLINQWSSIAKFTNLYVNPSIGWSSGAVAALTELLLHPSSDGQVSEPAASAATTDADRYGVSAPVARELVKYRTRVSFSEDTSGASEEVLLLLKKSPNPAWGVCEDYAAFARAFCAQEARRRRALGGREGCGANLRLRAFFAEADVMIGKAGAAYFEACWRQQCVREVVDFASVELPGTDHESVVMDFGRGALRRLFREVRDLGALDT